MPKLAVISFSDCIWQQISDSEKLLLQNPPSHNFQHLVFPSIYHVTGDCGYVAAPSVAYTIPLQSGPTANAAATSNSVLTSQSPIQILQRIPQTISTGQHTDLYNMQPHTPQNIHVPQYRKHNSTGRWNQLVGGNTFRKKTPKSSKHVKEYIQSTTIYPTMNQNVLLGQLRPQYETHPQQLQQCQYSTQIHLPMYFVPTSVPQMQRAVTNTTGVGFNSISTVGLTPTHNQRPMGTASFNQMPLGKSSRSGSTLLSVANTTTTPQVRVDQLVSMQHQTRQRQPQHKPFNKRKLGPHALPILHPITNRNILDDLDTIETESTEIISVSPKIALSSPITVANANSQSEVGSSTTISDTPIKAIVNLPVVSRAHTDLTEMSTLQTDKTEHNIRKVTDASTTTIENSNCVQESLPPKFFKNQQLPSQKPLEYKQECESKETCTEDSFGASEKENSYIFNIEEPVKIMQLGVKANVEISQPKKENIVNSNEQQQQEQELEQPKAESSNILSLKTITTTKTLTESIDVLNNGKHVDNINNKKSNNLNNPNKFSSKQIQKFNKKKKVKSIGKTKTTAAVVHNPNKGHNKPKSLNNETRNETDRAAISANNGLVNEENIANNLTKSPTLAADIPVNISTCNEKTKTETGTGNAEENTVVGTEENEEEDSSAMAVDTETNADEQAESLICATKRYDLEQLLVLRQSKASHILASRMTHVLKKFSIFWKTNALQDNKNVQKMVGMEIGETRKTGSGYGGNYQNFVKQNLKYNRADASHYCRNSGEKPIIYLNLSLNQEIKLKEADNAWRPSVLVEPTNVEDDAEAKVQGEKEELIRRVRGILNKLTPEKFEPLVEEINKLKIDTMDKMKAVMVLVFEKAIDEPNFSVSYANLCQRVINAVKERNEQMESRANINLAFRTALLDKTQHEFDQNVIKSNAKEEKLKSYRESISKCKDENEKVELKALLDEEERKIRCRSGGTVRFIGELFNINMLTGNIINNCIESLLNEPNNEDMLECLCKLLSTVGPKFEQTNMPKQNDRKYSLDNVIKRIQYIAEKKESSKISSRVRFMLQDVIDLRKKNWKSTRNEAPKTMEQIEKEANNEKITSPYHCMSSIPAAGGVSVRDDDRDGYNGGRTHGGSLKRQQENANNVGGSSYVQSSTDDDDKWQIQTGKGNRTMVFDSSKLSGMAVDMNNKKMGGADVFQWKKTSSQPTSTPSNFFASLSLDSNKKSAWEEDRDRSGFRNKGSYNKGGSIKRNQYDHRLSSQTGSKQLTRENSHGNQSGIRVAVDENSSNKQKSSSHLKHEQQKPSYTFPKMNLSIKTVMTDASDCNLNRNLQQQSPCSEPNAKHQQQEQEQYDNTASSELIVSIAKEPIIFKELSALDLKLVKSVVTDMIENAADTKCVDMTTVSRIKDIKESQLCGLIHYILADYLHLANVDRNCRRQLGNIVGYLIEQKYISIEHFRMAYKEFFNSASDIMLDIPELWLYIFEFAGPLIVQKRITVNDLWDSVALENDPPSFGPTYLRTFLQYSTREVGPSFTRNMWKESQLKWTSFMSANDVTTFIQANKFEYVENENSQPQVIDNNEPKEKRNKRVVEHIKQLLSEGASADNIIDYINGNIFDVDKSFIRSLAMSLINLAIRHSNNYSLDLLCFENICIPVLLRYICSKEDLELECLSAIQLLLNRNPELPKDLPESIFAKLKAANVISEDTFKVWRNSTEEDQ